MPLTSTLATSRPVALRSPGSTASTMSKLALSVRTLPLSESSNVRAPKYLSSSGSEPRATSAVRPLRARSNPIRARLFRYSAVAVTRSRRIPP